MLIQLRDRMWSANNQKGFTLVELMVVVIIIGALVAIAVPVYRNVQTKAEVNAHNANVRILQGAAANCVTTEGIPSEVINWNNDNENGDEGQESHSWGNYIESWPENPLSVNNGGAEAYTVTISTDGSIEVSPAKK